MFNISGNHGWQYVAASGESGGIRRPGSYIRSTMNVFAGNLTGASYTYNTNIAMIGLNIAI